MSDYSELLTTGGVSATIITALMKNPDLLKLIYSDVAEPSVRKVGEALSTVFDFGNTLLLPLKLLNEKSKILFTNSMEKYREKIEKLNDDDINKVPPEIGIPIMEKLLYTQDEDLASLYIELLANASNKKTCGYVHPLNIHIVHMITPDEAVLLKNMSETIKETKFPYILSVRTIMRTEKDRSFRQLKENAIKPSYFDGVGAKNIDSLYINNLISLGLFQAEYIGGLKDSDEEYKVIEDNLNTLYADFIHISTLAKTGQFLEYARGYLKMTTTCEFFMKSVGLLN